MKFGLLIDKTKVSSSYCKEGKTFNYFTHEPYSRVHSISNECQIGLWSYPSVFDGKLLNLNEFEELPDEEFDLIFLSLESQTPKFRIDDIKKKYNCPVFGMFKELWDVNERLQHETFSGCDKIITGVRHQVGLYKRMYGDKVFYVPQPVNIDYVRENFYVENKEDTIFCYMTADRRCIYNEGVTNFLSQKYRLPPYANNVKEYMDIGDFLKYFGKSKYHVNFDTEALCVGQQTCQCAALGVINLGGNNDATYNLFPETYGLDPVNADKLLHMLRGSDARRVEYEAMVLARLNDIYRYDRVKARIMNLV